MPPLLLAAYALDLCAVGLMLYAACRTEVEPMAAKILKPPTREDLLEAEKLLVSALNITREALALSEPEPREKHDVDAAKVAGDLALDAGGLLKGQ